MGGSGSKSSSSSSSSSSSPPQPSPSPPPPNPELDKPWRRFDWGKEALKQKLENFSPSHPDVKEIKILVAGQIGAGKSSFINSVESAFRGRICSRALVSSATGYQHSFTQKLKALTIKGEEKPLPFIFKDVMGLEPDALAGSQIDDIINAVFGHVKDGYKFNEEQSLTEEDQDFICDPTISDKSFCLVYVIDGSTVSFADDEVISKLKTIRQRISDEGIPQVIVMTKVDEACPLVKKDLTKIYKSKKIKEKMELCSAKVGVPMTNIFPVKNYHEEMDTDDAVDSLILKALEQILQNANDRLEDSENN